jgi:cytochrome c biogenesis protein CcdA
VLALALTAGMLAAVNPCGFALLPAYLSVLVARDPGGGPIFCTAALTLGFVSVFGAFGLVLAPAAGWLSPRLPWLTVVFGAGLALTGVWLLAGRSLPGPRLRTPRLTGSAWSMVLFGMAYAVASLGCAAGPFLAIVVTGLRAGSVGSGLLLFLAYAAGMGLVVGVTAVAVAAVRTSLLARLHRAAVVVPRLGGAVLTVAGSYVAYYGWYELRLAAGRRVADRDPVVNAAGEVQHWLSALVGRLSPVWLAALIIALLVPSAVAFRMRGQRRAYASASPVSSDQASGESAASTNHSRIGLPRRASKRTP